MLVLTMKDEKRLLVVQKVMDGVMKIDEGLRVLNVSERQMYRLMARVRESGAAGIVHGNRGNRHARRYDTALREKIVTVVREKYTDVNDTHLAELLKEREDMAIGRESLRKLLRAADMAPKRKRRGKTYRRRRERKAAQGTMIQIDASLHPWLKGQPSFSLVGGIDDATNKVWACFYESECTWGYLHLIKDIVMSDGVPLSLYSDRHTIFFSPKEPTVEEQLAGHESLTQFGRAMKDLEIEMIKAYSPQAKGRIERLWNTFQDRLVVELRLAGIETLEAANLFLTQFLPRYNAQFAVAPKETEAVFKKRPSCQKLEQIFCFKERRVVKQDHTISYAGRTLQIPRSSKWVSIAKQNVEVLQREDGSITVWYKEQKVLSVAGQERNNLIENDPSEKTVLENVA